MAGNSRGTQPGASREKPPKVEPSREGIHVEVTKRTSAARADFAEELSGGHIHRRERFFLVKMKRIQDGLDYLAGQEETAVPQLMEQILGGEKIPKEVFKQIIEDPKMKEAIRDIMNLGLSPAERKAALKRALRIVRKYKKVEGGHFFRIVNSELSRNMRKRIFRKILERRVNSTENPEKFDEWYGKLVDLEDTFIDGGIDESELLEKMDALFSEGVEEFGDEDVQEMWEEFQSGQMDFEWTDEDDAEMEALTGLAGEGEITDNELSDAIDQAVSATTGTGVSVEIGSGGAFAVTDDGFSLPLSVGVDEGSGEFLFYLKDSNSNEGRVGPFAAAAIAGALDGRHIDSRITKFWQKKARFPDSIGDIPDEDLINLTHRLIGDSKSRSYRIEGDNSTVLENLVTVLANDEEKTYSGLYDRIQALVNFAAEDDQADYLRRKLLEGANDSVSALIEEYESENV